MLKIDTDYAREKALEPEILTRHSKLQKRWRLSSYEDLIARKGIEKARANIKLRFYQDALESFKPRTRRDIRALYALCDLIPACPFAIFYFLTCTHDFGENVESLDWLPGYTSQISYYRSKQVQVYEFKISAENFERWAQSNQMQAHPLSEQEILSRDSADLPVDKKQQAKARPTDPDDSRRLPIDRTIRSLAKRDQHQNKQWTHRANGCHFSRWNPRALSRPRNHDRRTPRHRKRHTRLHKRHRILHTAEGAYPARMNYRRTPKTIDRNLPST